MKLEVKNNNIDTINVNYTKNEVNTKKNSNNINNSFIMKESNYEELNKIETNDYKNKNDLKCMLEEQGLLYNTDIPSNRAANNLNTIIKSNSVSDSEENLNIFRLHSETFDEKDSLNYDKKDKDKNTHLNPNNLLKNYEYQSTNHSSQNLAKIDLDKSNLSTHNDLNNSHIINYSVENKLTSMEEYNNIQNLVKQSLESISDLFNCPLKTSPNQSANTKVPSSINNFTNIAKRVKRDESCGITSYFDIIEEEDEQFNKSKVLTKKTKNTSVNTSYNKSINNTSKKLNVSHVSTASRSRNLNISSTKDNNNSVQSGSDVVNLQANNKSQSVQLSPKNEKQKNKLVNKNTIHTSNNSNTCSNNANSNVFSQNLNLNVVNLDKSINLDNPQENTTLNNSSLLISLDEKKKYKSKTNSVDIKNPSPSQIIQLNQQDKIGKKEITDNSNKNTIEDKSNVTNKTINKLNTSSSNTSTSNRILNNLNKRIVRN